MKTGYVIVVFKNDNFDCLCDGLYEYKETEERIIKLKEEDKINGWNYDYLISPFSTE